MSKDAALLGKMYQRDDGALMVEVRPGQFVNEEVAANLGLRNKVPPPSPEALSGNHERRQLRTRKRK